MSYLDVFYLLDPGPIECEGKVFVHEAGYWHVLVSEEQIERLPIGYSKFSELLLKRTDGKAYHTFSGYLERLETKDGGWVDRIGIDDEGKE